MVANSTVTITLPANTIEDLAGNPNVISNTVSLTYTPVVVPPVTPPVTPPSSNLIPTISLAAGQSNPTFTNEGRFVVRFNRSIVGTSFTRTDLAVSGQIVLQGEPSEIAPYDGTTFGFSGSGMVKDAPVQIWLPAGRVFDSNSELNEQSNTVELRYAVIEDHSINSTEGNGSGKAANRQKGEERSEFRPSTSNWTKSEFPEQYEKSLKEAEESKEGAMCQMITYTNKLGQEVFLGYQSGKIAVEDFGGANGTLPVRFTGLFRHEKEYLVDEGGLVSKNPFFELDTVNPPRYYVVNDFKDIETNSADYEVVVKMNAWELMEGGKYHEFRGEDEVDWVTVYKAVLASKNMEIEKLSETERQTDSVWQNLSRAIEDKQVKVDELARGSEIDKKNRDIEVLYTAYKVGLYEKISDLKAMPTKERVNKMLEELFKRDLEYVDKKSKEKMSRIEFARLFVAGNEEFNSVWEKYDETVDFLRHSEQAEKPEVLGNKKRMGSQFFRDITTVDTILNARAKRVESTGKIYPHTLSLNEWEKLQSMMGNQTKTGLNREGGLIDHQSLVASEGMMSEEGVKQETIEELERSGVKIKMVEVPCPELETFRETVDWKERRETFFNKENSQITKRFMVNDFKDIETGSLDYNAVVKMNAYLVMKSGRDHMFRPTDPVEWDTLLLSLMKVKEMEVPEMTEAEKMKSEEWQDLEKLLVRQYKLKNDFNKSDDPNPLEIEYKAGVLYAGIENGLVADIKEYEKSPTTGQVMELLEKSFHQDLPAEFNQNPDDPFSRIRFARVFQFLMMKV